MLTMKALTRGAVAVLVAVSATALAGCSGSPAAPDPISETAYLSLVRSDFPIFAESTDAELVRLGKTACKAMTATEDYGVPGMLDSYVDNPDLGFDDSDALRLMDYEASAYCPEVLTKIEAE